MQEFQPETSYADADQVNNSPNAFKGFVDALYDNLTGNFIFGTDNTYPYDYGITSLFLLRDVAGQDVVPAYSGSWYGTWYQCGTSLGPTYLNCQIPWTYYYKWIKSANDVISHIGDNPDQTRLNGGGQAYATRAWMYLEMSQMFAQKTYAADKQAITVPIVIETTTIEDAARNPRATWEKMMEFILEDLDKAEQMIDGYKRTDVYTIDKSVVYGIKARAYLLMEDWANAEKYAKLAQNGYAMMSNAEYTSRDNGFNTPNSAWMFATRFEPTDNNIILNDGDSCWGSHMILEINPSVSGCGYAANYGQANFIDRHLYETIPATDIRRGVFVDFAIDDLATEDEQIEALKAYSDYPEWVWTVGYAGGNYEAVGGLSLKFRAAGGAEGHDNQYVGFCVSVPLMRVEEMKLIEIEAVGMQNEGNGINLLTQFAKFRDPDYVYGTHNEAYYNTTTSAFRNEVWW
ncbi:MAG: RagB/SusD family nutrient uptake outer membrane protein, partial [Muribaculaceae bacterium]|nr:RagB/SusD family nutrient uptake outer membrane protein [Muribaculaceae bacterium]